MSEYRKIYRRYYDNLLDKKGEKKPNKLLGSFRVLQNIAEDVYEETFIGANENDEVFLITGSEVSGFNGGMAYGVVALPNLLIRKPNTIESDGDIESYIAALP